MKYLGFLVLSLDLDGVLNDFLLLLRSSRVDLLFGDLFVRVLLSYLLLLSLFRSLRLWFLELLRRSFLLLRSSLRRLRLRCILILRLLSLLLLRLRLSLRLTLSFFLYSFLSLQLSCLRLLSFDFDLEKCFTLPRSGV